MLLFVSTSFIGGSNTTSEKTINKNSISKLFCELDIVWTGGQPGDVINDTFYVGTDGDSAVYCEIDQYPNWGNWTFNPSSFYVTPEFILVVYVTVIVPREKNKQFTGEVRVVSKENPQEFCSVPVIITTPKYQKIMNIRFNSLLDKFPNIFPIPRYSLKQ